MLVDHVRVFGALFALKAGVTVDADVTVRQYAAE
jgi:hypothetical protein